MFGSIIRKLTCLWSGTSLSFCPLPSHPGQSWAVLQLGQGEGSVTSGACVGCRLETMGMKNHCLVQKRTLGAGFLKVSLSWISLFLFFLRQGVVLLSTAFNSEAHVILWPQLPGHMSRCPDNPPIPPGCLRGPFSLTMLPQRAQYGCLKGTN